MRGNDQRGSSRTAVATVCLKQRAMPPKPPPRIIVFTGTQGIIVMLPHFPAPHPFTACCVQLQCHCVNASLIPAFYLVQCLPQVQVR